MSPRAFMRIPSAIAGRQRIPVAVAASVLPPNLPSGVTAMMRAHASSASPPPTSASWVRRPVSAKNDGRNITATTSSSRSIRSRASAESGRQAYCDQNVAGRRANPGDEKREQAPADDVADGGAGERDRAELGRADPPVGQDAYQHREGR
jgi:hypothetical protein